MRTARSDQFPVTGEVLQVLHPVADGVVFTGLAAAQYRVALVLVALAGHGGVVSIDKPRLERLSGVRLDNAGRFMIDLVDDARIDHWSQSHGMPVFESIEYDPGKRGQTAGIIRAQVGNGIGWIGATTVRPAPIPADELRQYLSVGAILLRLRIGAYFAAHPSEHRLAFRLTSENYLNVFGAHGGINARVFRTSKRTGEVRELVSMQRLCAAVVEPAAREINAVPMADRVGGDGYKISIGHTVDGVGARRPWTSVDLEIKRLIDVKHDARQTNLFAEVNEQERYRRRMELARGGNL